MRTNLFFGAGRVTLVLTALSLFNPPLTRAQEAFSTSGSCSNLETKAEFFGYSTLCFSVLYPKNAKPEDREALKARGADLHNVVRELMSIHDTVYQVILAGKSRKAAKAEIRKSLRDICRKNEYSCVSNDSPETSVVGMHRGFKSFMPIATASRDLVGRIKQSGLSPIAVILYAHGVQAELDGLCDDRSCAENK